MSGAAADGLRARRGGAADEADSDTSGSDSEQSEDDSRLRRQGGVPWRVVVLLALALGMAYAGFAGGEALAEWWDSAGAATLSDGQSGEIGALGGAPVSHELEDDGDDDDDDESMAAAAAGGYAQLLHAYYRKHNPDRLGDVPMILARYSGKESELFAKLEKKYGAPVLDGPGKPTTRENQPALTRQRRRRQPSRRIADDYDGAGDEEEPESGSRRQRSFAAGADDGEEHASLSSILSAALAAEDGEDESGNESPDNGWRSDESDEDDQESYGAREGQRGQASSNLPPDAAFDLRHEALDTFGGGGADAGGRGSVQVIAVGFPGTGVEHLNAFLAEGLGLKTAGLDETCAQLRNAMQMPVVPEFNKFDRFEAIADESVAVFYSELIATYPNAKVVVAVRDIDDWYDDFVQSASGRVKDPHFLLRLPMYEYLLGNIDAPVEYVWKKRYALFYERLLGALSRERRKLMPVYSAARAGLGTSPAAKDPWHWLAVFVRGETVSIDSAWSPPQLGRQTHLRPVAADVADALAKLHVLSSSAATSMPNGHLKVIGVGLDETGSDALATALKRLGYTVVNHWYDKSRSAACTTAQCKSIPAQLVNTVTGTATRPNFGLGGIFHGADAVIGPPADLFLDEALASNPDLKVILMVRHLGDWSSSLRCKMRSWGTGRRQTAQQSLFHKLVYGSDQLPTEFMLHKRYLEHADLVRSVPADRLLVLDIANAAANGDAWRQLCTLLRLSRCSSQLISSHFPRVSNPCSSVPGR